MYWSTVSSEEVHWLDLLCRDVDTLVSWIEGYQHHKSPMAAAPVSNLFRHVAISIDTWELIINNRFDTYEAVRKCTDLETFTLV